MPSYLVTGASRGIGLSLVVELLRNPTNYVIATARNPAGSQGLQDLFREYPPDRLSLVAMEVSDKASVDSATKAVEELVRAHSGGLDCVINNAAIALQAYRGFEDLDLDLAEEEFRVNTLGPLRVTRAFLPLIRKGQEKKVVLVTSDQASLELAPGLHGILASYALTKAAMNMMGRKWGVSLRAEGITVLLLHPGWVETDMGSPLDKWIYENAPSLELIATNTSAAGCVRVIRDARLEDTSVWTSVDTYDCPYPSRTVWQLQDPQNFVIATARNLSKARALQELEGRYAPNRLALAALEVTDKASVDHAVGKAEELLRPHGSGLDCLINNAGVSLQENDRFEDIDLDQLVEEFRVNTVSPLRVSRAFLPLIRRGQDKKIAFMSSRQASIELAPGFSGVAEPYGVTKAALNMIGRKWGASLRAEGITAVLLHPEPGLTRSSLGWVDTDMGETTEAWMRVHMPGLKRLPVGVSAEGCIRIIKEARLEDAVQFLGIDGKPLPW
ncbi:uncharacterized protein FIBRA_01776 [Fibroporia radiculosa]|uniref:Uncharacterized protein n=1 Tax=Fibroporia radiculosa TaxID=599839 RepID=J4H1F1_9APHY|nr:uncharacterized protein FIBRA_01776 [Fibroporia radiculosa]CCL99754.1 predicted protein [Fibroporia radiculosa]